MAKIRSLLNLLKKLFVSDAKANSEKRGKKRRWTHGKFKRKRLPAIAAPPEVKERSLTEAEKAQSSHALTTAIATAVAAEAAVASAQAAVEVVRLTGTPWLYLKPMKESRTLAAIKIQTAFRGYLARKALRALKGLVRLQAMVRGQAVRRQVLTTLNGLQTLVKMQSQFRVPETSAGAKQLIKNSDELGGKKTRPELNSQRGKVDTLPSKEDIDALFLSRREALIKRERINEYLLGHRGRRTSMKFKDAEADIASGSPGQCLGQWVDGQECKGRITEKSDLVVFRKPEQRKIEVRLGLGIGDFKYHDPLAGRRSPITPPRRSFDRPRRNSLEDTESLGSPVPNYMSATESAKARLRSVSLPKQGQGSLDIYSDYGSPAKNRLSLSSLSTDASTVQGSKGLSSQQRSPSLKGHLGPIKSYRTAKDLSVDSDSSFFSWVQHNSFR